MPRLITPGQAYRHLRRYRQVIGVLTRYGFGEFFGQIRVWESINIERRLLRRRPHYAQLTTAQRLRLALEELGPTFVKMGQMLSTRPDLLSQEYIRELEKLQNRVAPMPPAIARKTIEKELQPPIADIFTTFDDTPLAAASLAQVHRAIIAGEEVVVKVQRPNVAQIIEIDLEIMHDLAGLMERYLKGLYFVNPSGLVREFSDNIKRELDFRIEANNMRRFAHDFAGTPYLHVPRLFQEHCCNQKVLVMEYIDGIQISDLDRLRREGYDLKLLSQRGADISFRSALDYGFFHADPHPGNLLILPDNVICLLDFGMMGTLSVRYRERLGKLLYFMSRADEKRTARALLQLIESSEVIDAENLEMDVANIIQEFSNASAGELHLGNMFFKLLRLLGQHRARFPVHMVWLFKSMATLEDLSKKMDPDFELVKAARPYARRMILKDLNPLHQSQEFYFTALDSFNLLRDLPYDAGVVLDQLKKGRVKIEFEHVGLEPIRQTLHQVSHHIALTLLLAALLISSSIIVLAGVPPMVGSIPVIGLVGFGISGLLTIVVVISLMVR